MLRRPIRDERYDPAYAYEDAEAPHPEVDMTESMTTRPARESVPVTTPRATTADRSASVIDAASSFDGKFESGNDLVVLGSVSGEILCRGQLTVEKDATARAKIDSRDAHIIGRVEGDIVCSGRLLIAATAVVTGTVKAAALIVEEGATIKGTVETASVAAGDSISPAVAKAALRRQSSEADQAPPGPNGGATPARWTRAREVPSFAVVPSEERPQLER